jgi:hypothetical protein
MEVVFGLEQPQGPERVTLSLPPRVELNATELSAFISALTRIRDGMLPAILRDDGAPIVAAPPHCEHETVIRGATVDAEATAQQATAALEVCVLCDSGRTSERTRAAQPILS